MVSTANMSKQESYRVSSSYLPQPRVEKTQLFQTMHWVFGLNANKPSFCKWNHGFIPALDTQHRHWRTLDPLPYNLNLYVIKSNETRFYWTLDDWVFLKISYEKPSYKQSRGGNLDIDWGGGGGPTIPYHVNVMSHLHMCKGLGGKGHIVVVPYTLKCLLARLY